MPPEQSESPQTRLLYGISCPHFSGYRACIRLIRKYISFFQERLGPHLNLERHQPSSAPSYPTHLLVKRELVLERVLVAVVRVAVDQPDVVLQTAGLRIVAPLTGDWVPVTGHQAQVPKPGSKGDGVTCTILLNISHRSYTNRRRRKTI